MATVKQVLAAISQDGTLGPNQKRIITEAVQRAETWCKLQIGPKPRKITNAKNLVTLQEWEEAQGVRLNHSMFVQMTRQNNLCHKSISEMVDEFRIEMMAKGKPYADFRMAFMTYLRKGWLSRSMASCTLEKSVHSQGTVIHTKGVNL